MFSGCAERLTSFALAVSVLMLSACGGEEPSAEERVRALIEAMQHAVEAGSAQQSADFLHPDYTDPWHDSRRAALRSLFGVMRRHRDINLFTLVKVVELTPRQDRASAVVFVAMTGIPVQSMDALLSLQADLYRFELELAEEKGEWRILNSRWERVDPRAL